MMQLTREWVEKAENDWNSANRLYRARKLPDFDGACFHAQQSAEKYLKARLQEAAVPFSKIHDLASLFGLLLPIEPTWLLPRIRLDLLSKGAVELRYPGRVASKTDAREAIATCREVRRLARASLGLHP
jgi:HEPN domain-containing protein